MNIMIDYKEGTTHSLNPFFGAGTAKIAMKVYRDEGVRTSAAGLMSDMDSIENKSQGNVAVISAQISGMAGLTTYQGQVEQILIPGG